MRFDLNELANRGSGAPPDPSRIAGRTFYYFGKGGGGVSYPDSYYFNLRGHPLEIDFDGRYPSDDNTPVSQTKEIEAIVLASLRTF